MNRIPTATTYRDFKMQTPVDVETLHYYGEGSIMALSKVDCFIIHQAISALEGGVDENLVWDTTKLVFNCQTFSHEDLYKNLFKLSYKGTRLGQE